MPWLIVDDRVLASVELAESWRSRLVGVVGRETLDGAVLLSPAKAVHTIGVRFAIDVGFCDKDLRLIDVVTMAPNRVGQPRPRAHTIIEAEAGSFLRWDVGVGDQLELRG